MTSLPMNKPVFCTAKRVSWWLFASVIVAYAGLVFLLPIADNDFWWHLKSGEYIVTHTSLPAVDPFTYPQSATIGRHEAFLLSSYWLSQSVIYLALKGGGFTGIIVLRCVLLTALFASVYLRMRRLRVDPWTTLILMSAALVLFGALYSGDRPQLLTFICSSLLLWMMEVIREGKRPSVLVVPLMAVWANLHGGFVIGDCLLALFGVGSLIQHRGDSRMIGRCLLWVAGGVAASFINPNGYQAFAALVTMAQSNVSGYFITEFMSSFEAFTLGRHIVSVLWWAIALTVVGIVTTKRRYWPDLLITASVAYLSCSYMRNVAFFAVVLMPVCAYYLDQGVLQRWGGARIVLLVKSGATLLFLALIVMTSGEYRKKLAELPVQYEGILPVEPVSFIQSVGIRGNMFNEYDWGGYLLCRLYPQYRVFIDGRVVRPDVFADYRTIISGSIEKRDGKRSSMELLQAYGVDFVIQRFYQITGPLQPLFKLLLDDRNWTPVYLDTQAYIFVKNSPYNSSIIRDYGIDRSSFVQRMLRIMDLVLAGAPADPRMYLAKADLLVHLGRRQDAERLLRSALKIVPDTYYIKQRLQFFQRGDGFPAEIF